MKFTLSWLKDHLDTDSDPKEIANKLTNIGFEIEGLETFSGLSDIVIATVIEAKKHPNADKLKLCRVGNGKKEFQVVCGANNVKTGMKAAFAEVGSNIPRGANDKPFVLREAEIRGEASSGMLVSEYELGISDNHDGIIECSADAPIGESYAKWLGIDDPVFDIAVTPNRPDALGVRALARELSTAGMGTLKNGSGFAVKDIMGKGNSTRMSWEIKDNSSEFVAGCVIEGVNNNIKLPAYIGHRLRAIGQRSINPIVDLGNYLMFDCSRPTHIYDLDKLAGNKMTIRLAADGESFLALDGKDYKVGQETIVIADSKNVHGIAGIIGGENSSVTAGTCNIFLEVALFDAVKIMQTGKRLKIDTDARHRFERGIDPNSVVSGLEELAGSIINYCGGTLKGVSTAGTKPKTDNRAAVFLSFDKLKAVSGCEIPKQDAKRILENLGFVCSKINNDSAGIEVIAPSWRNDVESESCLIEEVLRIWGYDKIPLKIPKSIDTAGALPASWRLHGMLRRSIASMGLDEQVNWSFCSPDIAKHFIAPSDSFDSSLYLKNPISSDLSLMRPSLMPHLLERSVKSLANFEKVTGFFELGPVFSESLLHSQRLQIAGVLLLPIAHADWTPLEKGVNIFSAKYACLKALNDVGIKGKISYQKSELSYLHPERGMQLMLRGKEIARFGELHPKIAKELGFKGGLTSVNIASIKPDKSAALKSAISTAKRVAIFEINLDHPAFLSCSPKRIMRAAFHSSPYPPADRDFAFVVDKSIKANDLVVEIERLKIPEMKSIEIFDVFSDDQGDIMEKNQKSIALRVSFVSPDRTLADVEIAKFSEQITEALASNLKANLR